MTASERKEYSLDLFARLRETLLGVLALEDLPEQSRKETEENLVATERLLDLIRSS